MPMPHQQQFGGGQYGQQCGQYGAAGGVGPPPRPPGQMVAQEESPVKEALGSAWQGLLGFGNKTREAVEQARETVRKSATEASQQLSTTGSGK